MTFCVDTTQFYHYRTTRKTHCHSGCVRARARAFTRAHACACVRACGRAGGRAGGQAGADAEAGECGRVRACVWMRVCLRARANALMSASRRRNINTGNIVFEYGGIQTPIETTNSSGKTIKVYELGCLVKEIREE